MDELEELDDDDIEIEERIETDLSWTCPNCKENNTEYNIPYEQEIICECNNCGKKYSTYYCPY